MKVSSVEDLSAVTSSYPIGTVEIIMPSVTEGNDIPISSTAHGSNVKEESPMSTDGEQSENEKSVDIVPVTGDVVQSPQNLGSASEILRYHMKVQWLQGQMKYLKVK